ncbi:UDP-glucose--hexose-1-phosphate uridylyltransferase [Nitrospira tepida]|uniref:Galactose-1-phosphate uridylyltransferase n=1 Tax=Nitrospira tepida TaxID=2973512 RepID=A0AA86N1S5_9BACT|nr:galactose-1-phosphate uridylyltransferase [Nitrospira tepida]CAI4033133.1 UDP-glucose--hexose-1-phosphate uridylyltransferase [Nitrospira tepida]
MPELRRDPIVGRWVIISTERGVRPRDFIITPPPQTSPVSLCPFCPGQELLTPKEILAYRPQGSEPNSPGWSVRVVPNKFPALHVEGELGREGLGMYDRMNGVGAHEVIIETPRHQETLAEMPVKQIEDLLWTYRDRLLDLKKDPRFRYILIFKNRGAAAGATLEHTHSQLIALPVVPTAAEQEMEGCRQHYEDKERCLYCDIVRQELADGARIVAENPEFVTLTPYAPRFPFEMWILPKRHAAYYEESQKAQFEFMAPILSETLRRMDRVLARPAYNMMLHTSPLHESSGPFYHWHVEIIPKLTQVAGFEWGTGFYINPVSPEESAKFLREAEL